MPIRRLKIKVLTSPIKNQKNTYNHLLQRMAVLKNAHTSIEKYKCSRLKFKNLISGEVSTDSSDKDSIQLMA